MVKRFAVILVIILAVGLSAKETAITIYNVNLGLVKDVRELDFKKGLNVIDFDDVAAQIDATSVSFTCLDDKNVTVLEQNFLYDLVSTQALLKRYLGTPIEIVGEDEKHYLGKLLSFDGGSVVLEDNEGKVTMVAVAKIVDYNLPSLPERLYIKPTLRWEIDSPSGGKRNCEVRYLTDGINWNADYVAVVSKDDDRLDLSAWVTIDNKSGARYENAKLKLVAGDVRRVTPPRRAPYEEREVMIDFSKAAPQFEEEQFFEYHLYTLSRPTTVEDKEIKQLSLFPTAQTAVKKVFVFESYQGYYSYSQPTAETKVKVNLEFKNSKEDGLGIPLPKGKLRVYKKDSENALQFIGEDMIDHTPKDEKVRVYIGDAFDIKGARIVVNKEELSKEPYYHYRETYEITLKNHKDANVAVTVVEHPLGSREWEIKRSNYDYRKVSNFQVEFDIPVAANGESKLIYTIEY